MADTIREQIISGYFTHLASWTIANGYQYPCGGNVERAVPYVEESNLPACVLWPREETSEKMYGGQICSMSVKLEALCILDGLSLSVVQERLLGDAIKIMMSPSSDIKSLIEDVTYTNGGPTGGESPEEKTAAVSATFTVKYKTKIGDPYSQ